MVSRYILTTLALLVSIPVLAVEPKFELVLGNNGKATLVRVTDLTDSQWTAIESQSIKPQKLDGLVRLFVVNGKASTSDRQSVFGESRLEEKVRAIVFEPRYPLVPGLTYSVELALTSTGESIARSELKIPKPHVDPSTKVVEVFPTASELPENLLKFYIHFSAPMSSGDIYRFIDLVSDDGKLLERPFLQIAEELWDPSGKRLTLLLDPARVKRGLVPHEEDGAILYAGKKYRLTIKPEWQDGNGIRLASGFTKDFKVVKADYTQPKPIEWKISAPKPGTRSPLTIDLIESLDHAIVTRGIAVLNSAGEFLNGDVTLSEKERVWSFSPDLPWKPGMYALRINDRIEDLVGNSINKPFEVDRFDQVESPAPKHVQLKFEVLGP